MKILTKNVIIENKTFYLVEGVNNNGKTYYGTISHDNTKQELNGIDMCISFESIADAIEQRRRKLYPQ